MKSIKSKILISMILTTVISLALVGGASSFLSYMGTQSTLESSMEETASVAADRVSYELQSYKNIAYETGSLPLLADPDISIEEKQDILQQKLDTYGLKRYNLLDSQGISLIDGKAYSDRTYYHEAMQGKAYVSEPLISSVTGEVTIIVSAPVWENGKSGTNVIGVVYFVPKESFLNDIVTTLQISSGSSSYMLDAEGNTIAHKDLEAVRNSNNTINEAKNDPSLEALAAIENKMISGDFGFAQYTHNGVKTFVAYAPIPDTNGWSIAINAPTSDFTEGSTLGIIVTIILLVVSAIVASFLAFRLALGIGKPVKECADRLELLSRGDLETPVPEFQRNDEIGNLVNSTKIIVNALSTIIKDIDHLLGQMGNGNFVIDSEVPDSYVGDFAPLLTSIAQIKNKLSDALLQIHECADQIASGAEQVSNSAQSLAQGATEQASSIQELASAVTEISDGAQENAVITGQAQNHADQAGQQVTKSNEQMEAMTAAMSGINDSSKKIGKIIATIEDIAFQTNILALNAAVEAARAGEAGKGFAVVADEVRNLASKSDEAAKATKELIESSIKAVENGSIIASDVTQCLHRTTDLAVLAVGDMRRVADAVTSEANAISQVTEGLDQISSVVQTNSATSEQSAAASQELASQAQMLENLVKQFQLPSKR